MLANRLEKTAKHLRKWARRTGVSCYRLYDKDIPEIPLAIDRYESATGEEIFLHIALYARPYDKPDDEEEAWMDEMKSAAADVLGIPKNRVFTKIRKRQRGESSQYEKLSDRAHEASIVVAEGGSRFLVNLSEYLDTGLFLDHRPARMLVREEAKGKRVLNLFCYTGAFSVHAAAGGAQSVTSVDLSATYLSWAAKNLALNGFQAVPPDRLTGRETDEKSPFPCVRDDVKSFLARAKRESRRWDIIVCDPPTFSNSKRTADTLDVNRDWVDLCRDCLSLLSPGGTLLFSTNSRSLKFDPALIGGAASKPGMKVTDLSSWSIPEDFRDKKMHRLWRFTDED